MADLRHFKFELRKQLLAYENGKLGHCHKHFGVRISSNHFGTMTNVYEKENCSEMQLSLFHPLGTLSHRVNEGGT
jgi:hypothetical protein